MTLDHPFKTPPANGEVTEVAPGILWAKLPLPFRLDHVNVYFIKDDGGWAIFDCGVSSQDARDTWDALLEGPLKGEKITRVIVSHHHPDHIGLAGWLCEKLDVEMWCGRETFLFTINLAQAPALLEANAYLQFYADNGMQSEVAEIVATRGHFYQRMITPPPITFRRLLPGKTIDIGGRNFKIMSGDGHCPEQIMLYLEEENLFIAADQVIEKISPNVSVLPFEPMDDPLGDFIESLNEIKNEIPNDAFVLAGHRLPFYGLHQRCDELIKHHEDRCDIILKACDEQPRSVNDILPIMFDKKLNPHEISFAFTEVMAHMNYLIALNKLAWVRNGDGQYHAHIVS